MNIRMNFDVWNFLLIFLIAVNCSFGKPTIKNINKDYHIAKRVEIIGDKKLLKDQASVRRQNVIHAGDEYDNAKTDTQTQPDELENLGKIIDYNGKIIDNTKSPGSTWKDTPGVSKDVIERIKEIQDNLIKRTGSKDLVEKLKLMQPEKNVTIASGSEPTGTTPRKVIPEDVVNKILEKFQELRSQAKTLATLDEKGKVEGKESDAKVVTEEPSSKGEDGSETASKDRESKEAPKADKQDITESEHQRKTTSSSSQTSKSSKSSSPASPSSPYESIGPPKVNEELRNITTNGGVTRIGPNGAETNQEVIKAPSVGPVMPVSGSARDEDEQNRMNDERESGPEGMQGAQSRQNTPGNMMMMGGKVPMMFIKQGEMLVPVFGEGGTNQQFQRSVPLAAPTPQMMASQTQAPLVPQSPAMQSPQSRSGLQSQMSVPSVPLSTIMSLMSAPNMIANQPASPMVPTQMNGGVYSVPQGIGMNQAPGYMQQYRQDTMQNQPNGEMTGQARQIPQQGPNDFQEQQDQSAPFQEQELPFQGPGSPMQGQGSPFQAPTSPFQGPAAPQGQASPFQGSPSSFQGQLSPFQSQFSPYQEQGSPFEEKQPQQTAAFTGSLQGQSSAMGNPDRSLGLGVSMDQSGRLSLINAMNSGLMQPQQKGPLNSNPFQESHPEARNNMEVMNKEKQLLAPYMANSVNDLSDSMDGYQQPNVRNLDPDALLELAKSRRTDQEMPPNMPGNPDSLLDNLKQGQLNRGLTGPGDPERIGANGMMNPPPLNPFSGTNPETLLDMLSKRNSKNIWNKDTMDIERAQQSRVLEGLKQENQAMQRTGITQIGTNGMQGISSLPAVGPGGLDPSFADYTSNMLGNQAVDVSSKSSALDNPVESSFFRSSRPRYRQGTGRSMLDVLSHDALRYEHSKHAIDSGEDINPINQADVYARHKITNPGYTASKRSMKSSISSHDNVELRVNGKALAEKGSLRSKIVDGKVEKGQGKTLTSKSPVKIELSHADDAKKTKIINIVTTGKYNVTDSKRDRVLKNDNYLKQFYTKT